MIRLSDEEVKHIRDDFERHDETSVRASFAWSRRKYAPMHIHAEALSRVRTQIREQYPDYLIAFDVVFEVQPGVGVDLHCDYESLGPFHYDRARAIHESHFVSIHFNLTEGGGALVTLPWPRLSLLHHHVISRLGLYSALHRVCNWCTHPLVNMCGQWRSNERGVGNVFDNMRLHMVTPGEARISYVVRLVRRASNVRTSPALLDRAPAPASRVLHSAIARHVRDVTEVDRIPWSRVREACAETSGSETLRDTEETGCTPCSPRAPDAHPRLHRA